MMKNKMLTLLIAVLLMVLLTACSSDSSSNTNEGSSSSKEESFELIIAHDANDSSSWSKAINKFAEVAEEKSGGRLTFKMYGNSQMGSQKQVLESIELGTVDMTYSFDPLSMWVPEINTFNLLYLFYDL